MYGNICSEKNITDIITDKELFFGINYARTYNALNPVKGARWLYIIKLNGAVPEAVLKCWVN